MSTISKNVHVNERSKAAKKRNNIIETSIEMKSTGIKSGTCINFCLELHIKNLAFRLVTIYESLCIKKYFQGVTNQIG